MSIVLAFSGRIASGKSTLSRAVAAELGWPRVSFGDYVRKLARERSLDPTSIPVLQDLGEELVRKHLDEFCSGVLGEAVWKPGEPLVIDGLRHLEVAERLRSLVAPSELLIVHINAGPAARESRLAHRSDVGKGARGCSLSVLDKHSTESQASDVLPKMADLIVDSEANEAVLVRQVVEWVRIASNAPLSGLLEIAQRHPVNLSLPSDASARHDAYMHPSKDQPSGG